MSDELSDSRLYGKRYTEFTMNIQFLSFTVPDQQRALEFYTNALSFVKHADIAVWAAGSAG